jgi:hypothetical protein
MACSSTPSVRSVKPRGRCSIHRRRRVGRLLRAPRGRGPRQRSVDPPGSEVLCRRTRRRRRHSCTRRSRRGCRRRMPPGRPTRPSPQRGPGPPQASSQQPRPPRPCRACDGQSLRAQARAVRRRQVVPIASTPRTPRPFLVTQTGPARSASQPSPHDLGGPAAVAEQLAKALDWLAREAATDGLRAPDGHLRGPGGLARASRSERGAQTLFISPPSRRAPGEAEYRVADKAIGRWGRS